MGLKAPACASSPRRGAHDWKDDLEDPDNLQKPVDWRRYSGIKSWLAQTSVLSGWESTLRCKYQCFIAAFSMVQSFTWFMDYRLRDCAESSIVSMRVDYRKRCCSVLMRWNEQRLSGCRPTFQCTIRTQSSALHYRFRCRFYI